MKNSDCENITNAPFCSGAFEEHGHCDGRVRDDDISVLDNPHREKSDRAPEEEVECVVRHGHNVDEVCYMIYVEALGGCDPRE